MVKYDIMAKGNIEVITKYFYPIAAGIETNTMETYAVLAKNGWRVTIHTSKDTYLKKDSLKDFEEIRGLKVKRYPYKSELSGYMPQINWDKTDIVALHNFNVSHFRVLIKALWMKLTKKKNFALVITPHGGFNPEWRIFKWPIRITKFIYQYFLGNIVSNIVADGFRAVSEWERREMVKKGISNKKIETITNGLEDEAYMDVEKLASRGIKAKVKRFGEYMIQIGRIYPIKNYETVIRSMPLINKSLNYVIVGTVADAKYFEDLKDLAKKLGVSKRLHFTGVVRGVDKYYLIKKSKFMVHMAIWESFCNVVHEGLSQGLICIVANNTALPLLVKNGVNGYTVKTKDHKMLAEKINFVIKNFNSKTLMTMRENNKKIGADDSWTAVANKMSNFYETLISKVRTPQKKLNKFYIGRVLLTVFITIFSAIILGASVRGNYGNPNPKELYTNHWRDNGPFELSPERGRYALLYSLIENKSFYYTDDIARFVVPDLGYKDGHYVSLFAPAISFIAMPGYIIGKMFNTAQVGAFSVICLFAILNSYLIKKISEKMGATTIAATIAGLIFIFATPAFAYGVSLYQHHVSTFLILFASYMALLNISFFTLSAIWFLSALAIPVDYPNLFLMFPIGIYAFTKFFSIERLENKLKMSIKSVYLLTFLSVIIPLGFFMWFNNNSYGDPLQFSGTVASVRAIDENGRPTYPKSIDPQQVEVFINPDEQDKNASAWFESRNILEGAFIHFLSPDRGMFRYTPVVLLGIFGIFVLYQKRHPYLAILLGIIGVNAMLYSMWGDPWGGWAFGSRYMIPTYAILTILLASALTYFNRKWYFILPFWILLIYSIGVSTLGALTTSAVPPKAESLALEKVSGKHERYSFDRNWEYLVGGGSKSFVFRTWGHTYLSSVQYFYIIAGSIGVLCTLLTIALVLTKNEAI